VRAMPESRAAAREPVDGNGRGHALISRVARNTKETLTYRDWNERPQAGTSRPINSTINVARMRKLLSSRKSDLLLIEPHAEAPRARRRAH
jgi:hypothetical protein